MTNTTQTTSGYTKSVEFDKETRDFCAYVNGEIMGFAKTRLQAEQICDRYVYEALRRTHIDAADLTPEDAADVLTALTSVDADVQAERAAAAAMQAEIQAEFEAEEARAGVEETRPAPRRLTVGDVPASFDLRIDEMQVEINFWDNTLLLMKRGSMDVYTLREAYALMLFFDQPLVRAGIQQAEAQRQQTDHENYLINLRNEENARLARQAARRAEAVELAVEAGLTPNEAAIMSEMIMAEMSRVKKAA